MILILKILVAAFGLLAGVAAIGGDTWHKESKKWNQKLTSRGWIALLCMIFSFVFGSFHEILKSKENIQTQMASELRDKKLENLIVTAQALLTVSSISPEESGSEFKALVRAAGFNEVADRLIVPSERVETLLHIRAEPSSESVIVESVYPSTPLKVIDSAPYYYKVEFPVRKNAIGWVSKSWVDSVSPK